MGSSAVIGCGREKGVMGSQGDGGRGLLRVVMEGDGVSQLFGFCPSVPRWIIYLGAIVVHFEIWDVINVPLSGISNSMLLFFALL